jgi:Carboxypeptidase regulatory-like domain
MTHCSIPRPAASRRQPRVPRILWCAAICLLFCYLAALAHAQQSDIGGQSPNAALGSISGTIVDQTGTFVVSAHVKLAREGQSGDQEVVCGEEGQFSFKGIPAGAFELTVSAPGFSPQEQAGKLAAGESLQLPTLMLKIAAATTEVQVRVTNFELAEEEIKVQETQRVLGVIPNFYVTYKQDALPLSPKQKLELAWKSNVDPVTFAASGAFAGIEQATNQFSGYGQGASGYAKRFGASYGGAFIGNMLGGALLPSLLKQDPRYFYKGSGSTKSRIFYALANSVICKGDNGRWQPNYSGIAGSLAAGGISNLYYPAGDRSGVGLTFENTAIGIGGSAIGNIFQEFVVRKLTPHAQGKP